MYTTLDQYCLILNTPWLHPKKEIMTKFFWRNIFGLLLEMMLWFMILTLAKNIGMLSLFQLKDKIMLQATLWVQLYQKDKKYLGLVLFNVDHTIIKIGSFVEITSLSQYF